MSKMDVKRFEEVRAHALTRRKPLVPPTITDVPSSSCEQAMIAVYHPSDHSTLSLRKKSTEKKRKVASSSVSPSFQGETMELVDLDE